MDDVSLARGKIKNVIILNGIAEKRTKLSASSFPKNLGISSPKTNRSKVEITRIVSSEKPNNSNSTTELSDAKVILSMSFDIRIVEKKILGLSTKYLAFRAIKYFLRARSSILILFETINAISDAEKKALAISKIISIRSSLNILSIIYESYHHTDIQKSVHNHL